MTPVVTSCNICICRVVWVYIRSVFAGVAVDGMAAGGAATAATAGLARTVRIMRRAMVAIVAATGISPGS